MGEIRLPIWESYSHQTQVAWTNRSHVTEIAAAFAVLTIFEALLIVDVVSESFDIEVHIFTENHTLFEWIAVLGVGIVLVFLGLTLKQALEENRNLRAVSGRAAGEFLRIMLHQMREWELTDSEVEIATMLIKGLTIQEIAEIRMTKAGTVKSQCHAVYRKAGVNSRNELAAFFIEDLMNGLDLNAPGGAAIVRV